MHQTARAVFSLPITSCNKGMGRTSLFSETGTGTVWAKFAASVWAVLLRLHLARQTEQSEGTMLRAWSWFPNNWLETPEKEDKSHQSAHNTYILERGGP